MPFRDDLEAARHQITVLESRLREQQTEAGRERQALLGRIDALERQLGRRRQMSWARLWITCWLPAGMVLVLQLAAIALAMRDLDSASWIVAQLSIVFGVLGTAWSWGARGLLWPWMLFTLIKATIVVAWGWGWWAPLNDQLPHTSYGTPLYFLWCAPFVVMAVMLVEGFLIRAGLRPPEER